jgi:hypothetical protein
VTFKDLQKAIESQPSSDYNQLQKLKGKGFWSWDTSEHKRKHSRYRGNCCFNHIIGPPKKDGVEKAFFDYEKLIYNALMIPGYFNSDPKLHSSDPGNIIFPFKEKHLFVKKATGLGCSEFFLRFMAWLCLKDDDYRNSQMVIVTGPNQELAIKLIKRMKALFSDKLGITFDSKETVLELNGCNIEAYPSNHLDAFRSLTNPKFILLDEADFAPKFQQDDMRHVSERYIAKSNPFIVLVSTPNAPGGLFQKIEQEPFDTCIYKKMFLDYLWGVGKIYSPEEIENAKISPSFPREYQLQYQGLIGNVFSTQSIESCQRIKYNPLQINQNAKKTIGVDAGFGSSHFAIVVTQFVDGKIQVIFAEDTYCKKYNLDIEDRMIVVPVPFSVEGAKMLKHAKWLLEETDEDGSSLVAIHKRFDKLLTGLRTAVANEYKLDKEVTSYDDIVDAFRLALTFYKRSK